jgi:hypothetical protein
MIGSILLSGCGAGSASKLALTPSLFNAGTATSSGTAPVTPTTGTGDPSTTPTPTPLPTPTPAPVPAASTIPGFDQLMALPFQAGITHVDGRYGFADGNYLIEGAQKVIDLGAPAIFLYMTPNFRTSYPDRGAQMWPASDPTSLTELAQTAPFQKVFSMPFKTIVITAYTMSNGDNIDQIYADPNAAAAEEKEFYDMARYLYSTYAGTGKTFVLKHWEGDFIGLHGYDSSQDIDQHSVDVMVTWLKARQHGVARARQDAGNPAGIGVFNAVECSLVLDFARGQSKVRVINAVVPLVVPDMVTYSSWDSSMQGGDPASASAAINEALDTIKQLAPDPLGLGNKRILISEYGLFENSRPTETVWRAQAILDTAKAAGLLGAFYWELFDNECTDSSGKYFPVGSRPSDPVRPQNGQCEGLSIVRPDASISPALNVLTKFWN